MLDRLVDEARTVLRPGWGTAQGQEVRWERVGPVVVPQAVA